MNMPGLRELSAALYGGQTTSSQLVERALERAHRSKSVFTTINPGLVRHPGQHLVKATQEQIHKLTQLLSERKRN